MHIPGNIHVGLFHYDTIGDCQHQQKKPLVPYDYRIFEQKCGARANELIWMSDKNTKYVSPYINHSAVYILFWSFEISDDILRNQK